MATFEKKNNIKKGILNNGIKYIINDNNSFVSCCIQFYIRVGSMHEKKGEEGITHLIEHMLFKGTERYQTFMELNKKFDLLNCEVNAATAKNYTYIDMKLPYQKLMDGLELVNQMVFYSLMVEHELEKEKKVVIEEFNKINDEPENKLEIITNQFHFKNHRLSNLILGTRKNVKNFTQKQIYKFYKKYYIPNNCSISIVGNVPKNIKSKLSKLFTIKSSKKVIHDIKKCNPHNDNFLYRNFESKLNHISIGFPIFDIFDDRKYHLDILIDILGGNMTSKLWIALRETNQLVYTFNVFYECYEDGGFFSINFSCLNKNVKKTITTIIEILENLKKIKISKDVVKLTKQKAIMDIDINSEGNCDITEFYGEQLVLDMDIKKYDDIKEIYKKCDEKILQDLCKEYFILSKMKIVLMGNIEEGKFNKITKELKI